MPDGKGGGKKGRHSPIRGGPRMRGGGAVFLGGEKKKGNAPGQGRGGRTPESCERGRVTGASGGKKVRRDNISRRGGTKKESAIRHNPRTVSPILGGTIRGVKLRGGG